MRLLEASYPGFEDAALLRAAARLKTPDAVFAASEAYLSPC